MKAQTGKGACCGTRNKQSFGQKFSARASPKEAQRCNTNTVDHSLIEVSELVYSTLVASKLHVQYTPQLCPLQLSTRIMQVNGSTHGMIDPSCPYICQSIMDPITPIHWSKHGGPHHTHTLVKARWTYHTRALVTKHDTEIQLHLTYTVLYNTELHSFLRL